MIGIEKEEGMVSEYNRDDNDGNGSYRLIGLRNRNQAFNPTTRPKLYYPLFVNPATGSISIEKKLDYTIEVLPETNEGIKTCWTWGKSKVENENSLLIAEKSGEGWRIFRKDYLLNGKGEIARTLPKSIWLEKEINNDYGRQKIKDLFGKSLMSFPKATALIEKCLKFGLNKNDLILDFFAGSGTTAHAVMDLNKEDGGNRKYICVQLPELCDEKSEAYKAGYKTIAEISKERIRRAGKKIGEEIQAEIKKIKAEITKLQGELPTEENKTEIENLKTKIEQLKVQDLGFKVLKLEVSNFKQWQQIEGKDLPDRQAGAKALAEQMKLFVDPVSESATIENMVYELLLKSGKDLNSPIEKNDGYFLINGNEMVLILEKVSQEIIIEVMSEYPKKVIALDKLFNGNDQLKTNTVLQMKDAGIEFKTI